MKKLSSDAALEEHRRRGERFEFLGRRLRDLDVEGVWRTLEEGLTLGDGRVNPDRICRALDEAEANLRRAGMLQQTALEEFDVFEIHFRAAYSEWSWTARESLERAKRGKKLSGHVTMEMVEDWVSAHVPDYTRWREQRRALERNRNLSKQLHEAWQSRGASLRKQADLVLARRGIDPNMIPRRDRGEGDKG